MSQRIVRNSRPLWEPPTLRTERLILRAVRESDARAIFEYARNPNVARYVLWEAHRSLTDAQTYIREYIFRHYNQTIPEPFGIALRAQPNRLIGCIGCFWSHKANQQMELAYAIGENWWGQGLVPEAARTVLNYVFNRYDVIRVQARCKSENTASTRVLSKIGFKHEGTHRSDVFNRGRYWDIEYHSILRSEWMRFPWAETAETKGSQSLPATLDRRDLEG